MEITKYITQELIEKSIDLTDSGTNRLTWVYNDIMEILDFLEKNKVIILGGDVLDKNLEYTYDNWFYQEKDYIGSIEYTKNYINNYYNKNGNDYYYVLVIKEQNFD